MDWKMGYENGDVNCEMGTDNGICELDLVMRICILNYALIISVFKLEYRIS